MRIQCSQSFCLLLPVFFFFFLSLLLVLSGVTVVGSSSCIRVSFRQQESGNKPLELVRPGHHDDADTLWKTYNCNLRKHLQKNPGTPLKPNAESGIYYISEIILEAPMQQQQQQIGMANVYQRNARILAATTPTETWCVAKPGLANVAYQGALDWACSLLHDQGNVDCKLIQPNQTCFLPDTYQNHASWAFNQYYQSHGAVTSTCNFSGIAMTTSSNPSTATCTYEGNSGGGIIGRNANRSTGDNQTTSAGSRVIQHQLIFQMSSALVLISYLVCGQV